MNIYLLSILLITFSYSLIAGDANNGQLISATSTNEKRRSGALDQSPQAPSTKRRATNGGFFKRLENSQESGKKAYSYQCMTPACPKIGAENVIYRHLHNDHSSKDGAPCVECKIDAVKFTQVNDVFVHNLAAHGNQDLWLCIVCGARVKPLKYWAHFKKYNTDRAMIKLGDFSKAESKDLLRKTIRGNMNNLPQNNQVIIINSDQVPEVNYASWNFYKPVIEKTGKQRLEKVAFEDISSFLNVK